MNAKKGWNWQSCINFRGSQKVEIVEHWVEQNWVLCAQSIMLDGNPTSWNRTWSVGRTAQATEQVLAGIPSFAVFQVATWVFGSGARWRWRRGGGGQWWGRRRCRWWWCRPARGGRWRRGRRGTFRKDKQEQTNGISPLCHQAYEDVPKSCYIKTRSIPVPKILASAWTVEDRIARCRWCWTWGGRVRFAPGDDDD